MFKRISLKYALIIVAVITAITLVFIPVYIQAQNTLYIIREKGLMESFCERFVEECDFSDNDSITDYLEENNIDDYSITIRDKQGSVVFSTRKALRKNKTSVDKEERKDYLNKQFLYSQTPKAVYTEESGVNDESIKLRRMFIINGNKRYMLIKENMRNVETVFDYTNHILLIVLIAYIVVCAVTIILLMGRITKSIRKLTKAAKKIAEKDYSVRYKGKISNDEVGALAENFNSMADTIQDNINSISNYNFLLKENINHLKEYEEIRETFVRNTTHELKTPLAIISSQVEMMNCTEDSEKREYYFNSSMEEIQKMSSLITNMLKFSANKSDANRNNSEVINASEKLSELCDRISSVIQYKKLNFERDILPDISINISEIHIEHIFNNFIMNAIKHAAPAGLIKVTLKSTELGYRLSVYNDGDNIPENELDDIWAKFYSLNNGDTGTGLGLYIVKEITYIYHDECGVENRDHGVEFHYDFII